MNFSPKGDAFSPSSACATLGARLGNASRITSSTAAPAAATASSGSPSNAFELLFSSSVEREVSDAAREDANSRTPAAPSANASTAFGGRRSKSRSLRSLKTARIWIARSGTRGSKR